MKLLYRRLACSTVAVVVFAAPVSSSSQTASQTSPPAALHERTILTQPEVFSYDTLPSRKMANGAESRDVLRGTLPTGESLAVHESILPAGIAPNPPHRIQHSEIITVIEGTIAFEHDGNAERVGPGGIIYIALGTLHAVRNIGDGPARYSVVALGGDVR